MEGITNVKEEIIQFLCEQLDIVDVSTGAPLYLNRNPNKWFHYGHMGSKPIADFTPSLKKEWADYQDQFTQHRYIYTYNDLIAGVERLIDDRLAEQQESSNERELKLKEKLAETNEALVRVKAELAEALEEIQHLEQRFGARLETYKEQIEKINERLQPLEKMMDN